MSRKDVDIDSGPCGGGSVSSFLRSLLSGIPWSEGAVSEESHRLETPERGVISVDNPNGKTRIIGEDRDDIQLSARKHARAESEPAAEALLRSIHVEIRDNSGALEIAVEMPRKWNRHGSADLDIRLPRNVRAKVNSSNGKLCIQGLRCAVEARSSNGSIRIEDVMGDIEITTANAKVACDCTCGHLVARSSNGKIEVEQHSGSLDASTSNGLIRASLARLAPGGVSLATSNGRIVLELPKEPDAEVDIRVDNGVIQNELDFGGSGNDPHPTNGRLRGRLGRGGSPIKLRTSNGTVSLR